MATYSVNRAKHATLVAATVDTVNLSYSGSVIRVKNRGTVGDIYFTVDGTTPVSGADEHYFLAPGENIVIDNAGGIGVVKLISSGTPAYSVEKY